MDDLDQTPIPDWGLCCPCCAAPLAGLDEYRCAACGGEFDIRAILALHRPIADIGLRCPQCRYTLTGLPGNRCPECGTVFYVRSMIERPGSVQKDVALIAATGDPSDHYVKKREPTYTGDQRPLPDFGLTCVECAAPLVGTTEDRCDSCRALYDLSPLTGDADWVDITRFVPVHLGVICKPVLYDAQIPYLVDNKALAALYSGPVPFAPTRLRVAREFFFDALHALTAVAKSAETTIERDWCCPECAQTVPAGFEVCWNCQTPHPEIEGENAE